MSGIARWKIALAATLLLLAGAIYGSQVLIFDDARTTEFYLVQDLAFLPISILVVTIIVTEILERRERVARLHKLNMTIGAFFSELGYVLLRVLMAFDPRAADLRHAVAPAVGWRGAEFEQARRELAAHGGECEADRGDLRALAALVHGHRPFLLGLLQNQSLLEHESFSELMWAVLHVGEELDARRSLEGLPRADLDHLSGDITRAYSLLTRQWLEYMEHLADQYPYLYSLAVRTGPLGSSRGPEVIGCGARAVSADGAA